MKILLSIIISGLFVFNPLAVSNVFICDSSGAVAYHKSKTCNGIQNCTHVIKEITLKEAIDTYKRRACKKCY